MIWVGGNNEITRDVVKDNEPFTEFIETSEPQFTEFRCLHKDELEIVIREALKRCPGGR